MKKLVFLILLNACFLLSPAPRAGDTSCGNFARYIHLTSFAGFTLNPDTYGFILSAIDPRLLAKKEAQRQSRPLFILAGSTVGYTFYYLTKPFHPYLFRLYKKFFTGTYPADMMFLLGNFYISFVVVNIIILWFSLYLFEKIVGLAYPHMKLPTGFMYVLMVFIVSNPVTKVFFWTVHQQMFAFFTPLFCVFMMLKLDQKKKAFSFTQLMLLSFGAGALLLLYGNFILLLPVLIYCFCRSELRHSVYNMPLLFFKSIAVVIMFAVPTLLWVAILKLNGVTYYNFEMAYYRQLVWVTDSLAAGDFIKTFLKNSGYFFATLGYPFYFMLTGLFVMLFLKIRLFRNEWKGNAMIFLFGCFFLFYWILGFYEERLSYTLVPIILCYFLFSGKDKLLKSKPLYIIGSLAIAWHVYVMFSYGPFC